MDEYYTWYVGSVWHKHWPEFMYAGQWPICHGPVILPYIVKTIWWINVIIWTLVPCDANIYLITCMWVSDLHFMVQWFCLLCWRLFDGWMLYWRYWFSVTQTLTLNHICRSVTCISWSRDFALYLKDYLIVTCHNWNIGSVWCKDLPHKMYVGQWPTLSCPVILFYILKTFWRRNVVLKILCDMGHWPVFHDLPISNHLPIFTYSGLLKFDMNIFVNLARLEIGQLFTQGARRGHQCTLNTFLVSVWCSWKKKTTTKHTKHGILHSEWFTFSHFSPVLIYKHESYWV